MMSNKELVELFDKSFRTDGKTERHFGRKYVENFHL